MRLRTTIDTTIHSAKLASFKSAVQRFASEEHKPGLTVDYVTVTELARVGADSNIRVIIDSLSGADVIEDAEMAALETVSHAAVYSQAGRTGRITPVCVVVRD